MTKNHTTRSNGARSVSTSYLSTYFGEPLSAESRELVDDVRRRLARPLHPRFDTDFNLYRFVMNAERMHRNKKSVVENASKALDQHLRMRKVLKLDELPDIPFEENVIFRDRFLPYGKILDATDIHNRLLWYIEYETISIEGIAHGLKSSEAMPSVNRDSSATLYQFWQFEHMLRRVNRQEEQTGRLSSLRHIIDMSGYEINPFTMIFVSSGTLSYYSQLFHYENYPELVNPIEMVNIAKWIHVPYKLIKAMMPVGFTDRFRLHDGNFLEYLKSEIEPESIPKSLGGLNTEIRCVPANKNPLAVDWQPKIQELLDLTESIQIPARKCKYYRIPVEENRHGQLVKQTLSWYFQTDGDVYFGVFYEPHPAVVVDSHCLNGGHSPVNTHSNQHCTHDDRKEINFDEKEYAYPWFKLSAKLYHEHDHIECGSKPGIYYLVFCNRHSWLQRRNVNALVQLTIERELDNGGRETETIRFNKDGSSEKMAHQDGSTHTTAAQ